MNKTSNQLPTDLALPEVDGEIDELTVLLHQLPQTFRLQELLRLLLQEQADRGPSLQCSPTGVWDDRELTGVRLPDVLLVIVVLGGHHHRISNWGVSVIDGSMYTDMSHVRFCCEVVVQMMVGIPILLVAQQSKIWWP